MVIPAVIGARCHVALGEALGEALGVAHCVVRGVARGVALGVALDVALGVALGVVLGVVLAEGLGASRMPSRSIASRIVGGCHPSHIMVAGVGPSVDGDGDAVVDTG